MLLWIFLGAILLAMYTFLVHRLVTTGRIAEGICYSLHIPIGVVVVLILRESGARRQHRKDPTNIEKAKRYWKSFGPTKRGVYAIEAFGAAEIHSPAGVVAMSEAFHELMLNSGEPPRPEAFDSELRTAISNALTAVDQS